MLKLILKLVYWDVVGSRGILISSSIAFTILAIQLFCLTAVGLINGQQSVAQYKLLKNPFAKSMWVGHPFETSNRISPELVSKVKGAIERGSFAGDVEFFPYRVINIRFQVPKIPEQIATGRLIVPGERFADNLVTTKVEHPQGKFEGLIVTADFRDRLELDTRNYKAKIWHEPIGKYVPIPVDKVVEGKLPHGFDFLVSESAWNATLDDFEKQNSTSAASGVMNRDFCLFFPPDGAVQLAKQLSVEIEMKLVTENGSDIARLFVQSNSPRSKEEWDGLFKDFMKLFEFETDIEKQKFLDFTTSSQKATESEKPNYDMLAVYVSELGDLKTIASVVDQFELLKGRYNKEGIAQLSQSDSETQAAKQVAAIFLLIVLALGASSVLVMQLIRNNYKAREFGLFLWLGLKRRQLLLLIVLRALAIGIPAALVGWGLTHFLGTFAAKAIYNEIEAVNLGFKLGSWHIAFVSLSLLCLLVVSSVITSIKSFRLSPASLQKRES